MGPAPCRFDERWQSIHRTIKKRADEVIILSPRYHCRAFFDRNNYMIERSSLVICYHKGLSDGTAHTLRLADKKGIKIVNLAS